MDPAALPTVVLHGSLGLCLNFIDLTRRNVGQDLTLALIFAAIMNANTSYLDNDPETSSRWAGFALDFPEHLRRPIRATRLAESLGLPRETTRTKVRQLVETGWAHMSEGGVVVRTEAFYNERGIRQLEDSIQSFGRFIASLADAEACDLYRGERLVDPTDPIAWAAIRMATHHVLQTQHDARVALGCDSLAEEFILLSVMHDFTSDLLAGRQPVPTAAVNLAESLMMPRETTRRHVNALIAKGHLVREVDGVLISPTLFSRDGLQNVGATVNVSIRRMVRRLRLIGALVHPG
jgi:hypothetical protein